VKFCPVIYHAARSSQNTFVHSLKQRSFILPTLLLLPSKSIESYLAP